MNFDTSVVEKLEVDLNDTLFDAYGEHTITANQIKPIAVEVVAALNNVNSWETLQKFLADISAKYNFFSPLVARYKGEQQIDKEKVVIDKLSKYITNMTPVSAR